MERSSWYEEEFPPWKGSAWRSEGFPELRKVRTDPWYSPGESRTDIGAGLQNGLYQLKLEGNGPVGSFRNHLEIANSKKPGKV